MLLLAHILVAVSTVIIALYAALQPKQNSIRVATYGTALTAVSGIAVGIIAKVSIGRLCLSGLAVVGFCAVLIYIANLKLAKQNN